MVLRDLQRASLDIGFTVFYGSGTEDAVTLGEDRNRPVVLGHAASNADASMSISDAQRLAEALRQPNDVEEWDFETIVAKTCSFDRARPCPNCSRPFWEEQAAIQIYQGDVWAGGIPTPNTALLHMGCATSVANQIEALVEENTARLLGDVL